MQLVLNLLIIIGIIGILIGGVYLYQKLVNIIWKQAIADLVEAIKDVLANNPGSADVKAKIEAILNKIKNHSITLKEGLSLIFAELTKDPNAVTLETQIAQAVVLWIVTHFIDKKINKE